MNFTNPLIGQLIHRENRFIASVQLGDQVVIAHVPNSGRCQELLFPGNKVVLQQAPDTSKRKTKYSLILAQHNAVWVCLVSVWANPLTQAAAEQGLLPELAAYSQWQPEHTWGGSRLDFLLTAANLRPCLVEVKGVTLVPNQGQALFPDAPTARGYKHLTELTAAVNSGYRSAVVFVVQRQDATVISPNQAMDPAFTQALTVAKENGVLLLGFSCQVDLSGIQPLQRLPVKL